MGNNKASVSATIMWLSLLLLAGTCLGAGWSENSNKGRNDITDLSFPNTHKSGHGHHHTGNRYNSVNGYTNGNGQNHINGYGNGQNGNGNNGNGNQINGNGYHNGNGHQNGNGYRNGKYICPPGFIRNGNSCYYFSTHMETWQDSHFACQDRKSELARLEKRWEDHNMRSYLNKPELARLERWIGGIYNWERKRWVWGATGRNLRYQGFSRRNPKDDPRWHCTIMDPNMMYRWGSRSCIQRKHYICETPLRRAPEYDNQVQ